MKLHEEMGSDEGDLDVLRRVRAHGEKTDKALPAIAGSDIRQMTNTAVLSPKAGRGRFPFLAAAAAVLIVGGFAALTFNRTGDETRLEATPSSDADADADAEAGQTDQTTTEPQQETAEAESASTTGTSFPDLRPTPVAPADFGASDVRFLPPPDSGFVVSSGSRVLLSEADLELDIATPVRTQRVALPASDPEDRRGILLLVSTYADEADASAVVDTEPTPHGYSGEPTEIGGLPGAWHEEEGFAPFSAGNPMTIIRTLRVRLDANTVLDVATADVDRSEIEALVTSLVFSADGLLETPTPPDGFDGAEPIDGVSALGVIGHPSGSDYLSMVLVGANGEQVDLTMSPESAGISAADAHFETVGGFGWIEVGLFGETIVSFVGPDITLVLANYDGQVSADELIALAGSIQPVDDETWVERLAIAPLFDAPISDVLIED